MVAGSKIMENMLFAYKTILLRGFKNVGGFLGRWQKRNFRNHGEDHKNTFLATAETSSKDPKSAFSETP